MNHHLFQEQNFTTLHELRTCHHERIIRLAYRSILRLELDEVELTELLTQFHHNSNFAQLLAELRCGSEFPRDILEQTPEYETLEGREGKVPVIEPMSGLLQYHDENGYNWRSDDRDPWFLLKDISQKLYPGWYMIELCIHSERVHGNAKLYFDYGEGYNEAFSVTLPFRNGELVKRLYHLEYFPKQVRFDPLETISKFSVAHLNFVSVKPISTRKYMLAHIRNHSSLYKGCSIIHIWRDLKAKAEIKKIALDELLYQRYNQSFRIERERFNEGYAEWIAKHEKPEYSDMFKILMTQQLFKHQPTISVIMPVYNSIELFLRQAIESVLAQSYTNWELCIADDASTQPHVRVILNEYVQRDPRIKVIYRAENGHISAASNSALALATGEYVALMDHDDELAQHALHFVVQAINQNPSAQIIYSDEDKIDTEGNRTEPHFKSDWNPDLFFSQNYVSHLGVYRHALLKCIGGFRIGFEGSQDQDLVLRCLPHVNSAEILHIPKVLYHWRIVEGSTAFNSAEKNYTTDAGINALQDFFNRQGREDVKVEIGYMPNTYRVRYPIPRPEPLVSLLIPTRDKLELLEPCIRSILDKTIYQNYEIIILDNESAESATLDFFKCIQTKDTRVKVLSYRQPFNYSAINNYGVQQAKGELIGLINNDIEVISPEWLTEMVSHALRPEIGCVGAKLYYDDETIQHAGVIVGLGGVAGHSHKYFPREASGYFHRLKIIQNLSAVTAACLVVRKAIFEQVGGLEETNLRVAFNDVDFCLKVREAGYRNLWTPYAELYHFESKSRGVEDTPEKVARFNKEMEYIKTRWGEALRHDPYYSKNLTLAREDFSIGDS
ncbi:Glycosyltransferase, GT2 family [Nitrosomonas nitrosa]|uniref:Glycosyltransferase, GT2 family n=1 Tax=Nitrosomonas nitrosa TaxID=52442 RepID=A0A8H8Z1X5_9PROT|nr:glycosyltransferase family 2 protein [Nitrosomonas nitrosa]CAE6518407.1 Glycosyltransferase, GT2 family [Nitrosomonas nitrosa]